MADKIYKLIFTKDDDSEDAVQFTVPQGEPGKTPVKGEDYMTPEDVQEIAEMAAELVDVPYNNEILPETELVSDSDGWYVTSFIEGVNAGEIYTVKYNGVPYKCVGIELNQDEFSGVGLGNFSAIGGADTGEPFAMFICSKETFDTMGVGAMVVPVIGGAPKTVSIYGKESKGINIVNPATVGQIIKVSTVDSNGVPTAWEAVDFPTGGGSDVFTIVVDIDSMTADKTNEEIYAAYQEAKPAYMLAMGDDFVPAILQPVMVLPTLAVFTAHTGTASVVVRIDDDVVQVEGFELAKAEDIPENVSAFTNDAGYQTAAQVESIVEEAMKDIPAGGGGSGGWKLVKTFTANEDISNFYCNFEKEYKKVRVVVKELSETGEGSANVKKDLWVTLNNTGYTSDKAQKLASSIFGTNYGKAYLVFDFETFDIFVRCEYNGYANNNVPYIGSWLYKQEKIGNSINSINLHLGGGTILAGLTVEVYEEG